MNAAPRATGRPQVLHETAHRLRLAVAEGSDIQALRDRVATLQGVTSVRANARLHSLIVQHDGAPATRAAVIDCVRRGAPSRPRRAPRGTRGAAVQWTPALAAAAVPILPRDWRPGAALGVIAARVAVQGRRLRGDPAGVLLDAVSLASLALGGQPQVVSTAVLLRTASEQLAARLVGQTDALLDHLLPTEAQSYRVLRDPTDAEGWSLWPLRTLRAGDRVRLFAGDVVPVDGCALEGAATVAPAALAAQPHAVSGGDHLMAGDRLTEGTLEMRAEADVASSRLERLRAHVRHAIGSRGATGHLGPATERLLSLPLTAAALVLGLTGDSTRAASMLQADPQQGLDLALPLAREAALVALARGGLVTAGLEVIERLAQARTLVLQDSGVLASGRWTVDAIHTEAGGDADQVRRWLAALADTPLPLLDKASFPDSVVRQWVRHGALLRLGDHEVHLADRRRLARVWALSLQLDGPSAASDDARLRRELAVVAGGRVVARVVLGSAMRPGAFERIAELAASGIQRIGVFVEPDGADGAALWPLRRALQAVDDAPGTRADWLAAAQRDGSPVLMVHTVLRDLVPPGSLSLTPTDADAGAHGVLLGDPLASLVAARRIAQTVHRRLRLQQGAAAAANAALMTTAALRWLPPMATTVLHHGFALLLLLDSLRIERLAVRAQAPQPPSAEASPAQRGANTELDRSETA